MGFVFKLAGGAISWSSKQQSRVALSTSDAKYLALTHASQEAIHLRKLLKELGIPFNKPVELLGDNAGSIFLSKNPAFHQRSRHIMRFEHYVRKRVACGNITVGWIPTNDMTADILTKALSPDKIKIHRSGLGLHFLK